MVFQSITISPGEFRLDLLQLPLNRWVARHPFKFAIVYGRATKRPLANLSDQELHEPALIRK